MLSFSLGLLWPLTLIGPAQSSPAALDERGINCAKVVALPILKILSAQATSFCKTFIHIQTSTSTVVDQTTVTPSASTITVTTSTSTAATTVANPSVVYVYTTTITSTASTVTPPTSTSTILNTDTTTITSTTTGGYKKKRDLEARTIPAALVKFASSEISSACSCLGIPTPVSTVTSSSTTTAAIPTSTVKTDAVTTVTIGTVTQSTDTTILVTATATASTVTVTSATTTTSVVYTNPAVCSNLPASPVNYQKAGIIAIAGVGGSENSAATSANECCAQCQINPKCFGFGYGNYDPAYFNINDFNQPPPITSGDQCYQYVFMNGGCNYNYVAFGPDGESGPAGGSSSFGYGACSVSPF